MEHELRPTRTLSREMPGVVKDGEEQGDKAGSQEGMGETERILIN